MSDQNNREQTGISTHELISRLDKLDMAMALQRKDRHDGNSKITTHLIKQGEEEMRTHDRISRVEEAVERVAVDVREIRESIHPFADFKQDFKNFKLRIVGDEVLKTDGLIAEHNAQKVRLTNIENIANDTRREQRIAIAVLGGLASIIGFAKASGLITWLIH